MAAVHIPHYFIYGEHSRQRDTGFVHVERISDRWALHGGRVMGHHHPHLCQLSYWLSVDGLYSCDGDSHRLEGPALIWMPAGVVHGFCVSAQSDCIVISLSADFTAQCLRNMSLPEVNDVLQNPFVMPIAEGMRDALRQGFERVEQEYRCPTWAQFHMIEAQIRLILLDVLRTMTGDYRAKAYGSSAANLFRRFLALLEERFRTHRKVADYSFLLGTTSYLLNQATRQGSGMKAADMITARVLLEAKRLLTFTALDIGEVAWVLGFADPAHFGRLFRREMGLAPGKWRDEKRPLPPGG